MDETKVEYFYYETLEKVFGEALNKVEHILENPLNRSNNNSEQQNSEESDEKYDTPSEVNLSKLLASVLNGILKQGFEAALEELSREVYYDSDDSDASSDVENEGKNDRNSDDSDTLVAIENADLPESLASLLNLALLLGNIIEKGFNNAMNKYEGMPDDGQGRSFITTPGEYDVFLAGNDNDRDWGWDSDSD